MSQKFPLLLLYIKSVLYFHCLKKVCILSFLVRMSASPYSLRMRENTDQKNLKYGHFLRSIYFFVFVELFIVFARIFAEFIPQSTPTTDDFSKLPLIKDS